MSLHHTERRKALIPHCPLNTCLLSLQQETALLALFLATDLEMQHTASPNVLPVPTEKGSITALSHMVQNKLYCALMATSHSCTLQMLMCSYPLPVPAAQPHCDTRVCRRGPG